MTTTPPLLLRDHEARDDDPLGGKARALHRLRQADLPIPAWLVVTPQGFLSSLPPGKRENLERTDDPAVLRALVADLRPSPELREALCQALAELGSAGELLAVRSSASDEDGARHSFAGQLESYLFVPPEDVPDRVADVWRSGFSERIIAYRTENALGLPRRPPSVLIQRMIHADAAGVAFGADPVSGRRAVAVVSAVPGLGTSLVSGECDADTYRVGQDGAILERSVAEKRIAHRAAPGEGEGVRPVPLPRELAGEPVLTDAQVQAVAALARQAGKVFSRPQDIEWAYHNGKLYLLQSRPITSLAQRVDPDGAWSLWDNSNIAESYSGTTTPLTFSFIRLVYEAVYRQFCRILSVPAQRIEENGDIFRRMLGLVRGRVYYSLLSWYRMLALLPGFKANRAFMEQMMGVRQSLPAEAVPQAAPTSWLERLGDRLAFFRSLFALGRQHFSIGRQIRRFYERLEGALGTARPDLSLLRPDQLVACYRDLERRLLKRWDAPLVNDFFAMIFYGVLGKLTRKWCGDADGTLHNDLLCGEGGMVSAEPAARVRALALVAVRHPSLVEALTEGPLSRIRAEMAAVPDFRRGIDDYLDRFGDRCLEELKLESATLFDDPLNLLRSVGHFARRLSAAGEAAAPGHEAEARRRAEERVAAALRWRPLRRAVFRWVLRNARARVRDRENLRFERTRLFGRVRQLFLELGRRFHALDLLDDPRDVFFLELHEVLGFVEGTAVTTRLRDLVALRRAELDGYHSLPPPADRFETRGIVHHPGAAYESPAAPAAVVSPAAGDVLRGLGCCPGVVRGPVRVVRDPRTAILKHGEILVAERTDPGWIMLFPAAAGLLVERGSLLSHSAIVAREMAIPAIVSIPDITRALQDGDEVEMDGSTGLVRLLAREEACHEK